MYERKRGFNSFELFIWNHVIKLYNISMIFITILSMIFITILDYYLESIIRGMKVGNYKSQQRSNLSNDKEFYIHKLSN